MPVKVYKYFFNWLLMQADAAAASVVATVVAAPLISRQTAPFIALLRLVTLNNRI